ncbi:helix-turn-helix domain-containing protein [Spirillospora sp. CA-128828]|uniref:helix-turn-helix domain-containing protein n=1 Tax=Spirillospora sp. CA-128828 TaxID=3240033 RepID=UPI003D8C13A5
MAFCYLDPASSYADACRAQMTARNGALSHTHRAEKDLLRLSDGASWLTKAAPASSGTAFDQRIHEATRRLLRNPASTVTAAVLAAEAGLSVSRFLHLFKAQTGTSFRRYRLWSRMLRAAESLDAGHDLTRAAAESGFSSPSHLSSAFHDTFGLTPSRLLAIPLTILRSDRSP